ncbi:MAG: hypothetical protein ABFS56_15740 [Pseudomonadota bacterium]
MTIQFPFKFGLFLKNAAWLVALSVVFLMTRAHAAPLVHDTRSSHFYCLDSIDPDKEVIILVHGWSAFKTFDTPLKETEDYYEEEWKNFIAHFKDENVCLQTWDVREGIPYLDANPLVQVLVKLNSEYKIPYARINIIAHSQGGNYSKDALVKLEQSEQVREIELVTLGTPHTGSERLYTRNVLRTAEILGYTSAGMLYGAWLNSLYKGYQNADTEAEKNQYRIWLGVSGAVGVIGAVFIGKRISQFDEIYNNPGLLQLLPSGDNPVLRKLNRDIQALKLQQCISAIYSDYGIGKGDEVVPVYSGSWSGVKLKTRQLVPGRTHLELIKGDAEIFGLVKKMIWE